MTDRIEDDEWRRRREAGKSVPEKSECPICEEKVRNNFLPEHIREEHSSNSEFPPEP